MPVEEQFSQCVVSHAACVLAGIKPAALFNFIPRRPQECAGCACGRLCDTQVRLQASLQAMRFTQRFGTRGVRCDVLAVGRGRALILVSRAEGLQGLIDQADVAEFLAQAGLDVLGPRQLVRSLRLRMAGFERSRGDQAGPLDEGDVAFPHEVGVVLGYPLADVRGFIEHDGRDELACGVWKAYTNPAQARRRWGEMRACRSAAMRRYACGAGLSELIA